MTDTHDTDLREKLFDQFREVSKRHTEVHERITEHHSTMEALHAEMNEVEREQSFLRRVVHMVLVDEIDPVLAKFKVSDEIKHDTEPSNKIRNSIGYVIASEADYRRASKFRKLKRMFNACREIWNDRY